MKRKIVLYTNQKLRKKSTQVLKIDNSVKKLIKDMIDTMRNDNGIGLSAIQIDKPKRVIVYEYIKPPKSKNLSPKIPLKILINPKITKFSKKTELDEEGCLSFPNLYGIVKRSTHIKVTALGLDGKEIKFGAKGLEARVIQHEIDHLDGILFVDHLKDLNKLYTYEIKEKKEEV